MYLLDPLACDPFSLLFSKVQKQMKFIKEAKEQCVIYKENSYKLIQT